MRQIHEWQSLISAVSLAMGTTGDKATLTVPFNCEVRRVFVLIQGTDANATAGVVKFDKRPTAGSDTGRGDGDVGTISKTASLNEQGKYLYEDPTSHIALKEGEQVIVQVTTAQGAALAFTAGIVIQRSPEDAANNTNMKAA